jgi:type 1 glutamine amidotransferase
VREGAGLAGCHGGLADAFRKETEYQFMVGGQFVAHPGGVIDYAVSVSDPADEVMAGIKDFRLRSEQYYMHVDPNNKVLATTRFSDAHAPWIAGATMPVAWKRVHGRGRVFFSALGHKAADFAQSEVFEIAKRGVLWASESRHAAAPALVSPVYAAR